MEEKHDEKIEVKPEAEKAEVKEYSDKEKAEHNLKKQAERAKEAGLDPLKVLGKEPKEEHDEIPEWYKREQAKNAQKTALQLADAIADEDERKLVKEYLTTRIKPSDNPESDFRLAFSAVRGSKNKEILEELNRRNQPRGTASGGSQEKPVEEQFTPTPEEAVLMAPPWNLSKEKIIAARR